MERAILLEESNVLQPGVFICSRRARGGAATAAQAVSRADLSLKNRSEFDCAGAGERRNKTKPRRCWDQPDVLRYR